MTTHQCHDGNLPGNTGLMVGEEGITLDDAGEQPVPLLSRGNDYGGLIGFAAHLDGDTGLATRLRYQSGWRGAPATRMRAGGAATCPYRCGQ